ncbi:MAG: beta-galactosidase [Bacteroidales bacterium]
MKFSIKEDNFYLHDEKAFLLSGEIHYFRIKRELWDKHLDAAKEAGLRTISSYVPWAWHENEEQVFDFDGTTCPERDLKGWLKLCQSRGLTCILKPGPFILAEFRGAGLPDWFMDRYGVEVKMRNSKGNIVASDGVSLFHEKYLEKVTHWYDRIMPFISRHEVSAGGPVIMMQICNEIGVFSWLAHQADYCEAARIRFIRYIKEKFETIAEVNSLWGTNYSDFSQIELPPDGRSPYASKQDRGRDYEWHCFWRTYYGEYLRMLSAMARKRGVTVPLYHNLPGWIYGNGYEFPLNITMYDDLFGEKSEIIFGVDHIPEFMSYRNLHDDRIINDITYAMQGNKPLFAAEFQCGSREYHVVTNPREMELFYKASIANGLTGWNYYMFSQGRNPRHKGYSGETFYWFNPLTAEGERTSAFPLVQRMNKIISTAERHIVDAKRKAEVCVLFYPPYYATELERPETGNSKLNFNASSIRRPAYFDGLLKALQVLNIDYDMMDLSKASPDSLRKYRQVWAFSTDEMNARDQQVIVDYTRSGGQIVVFPCLPDREMTQKPCTILRDALSVTPAGTEIIDSPLIDVFDRKDIKCANPLIVYSEESMKGVEIIARTLNGKACGFMKNLGKGSVVHLGTWIGFDTEGHKPVYEALLKKSQAKLRQASTDNDYLAVRERFSSGKSAVLFVGNYYNEEHNGSITYTHPESGEILRMPYTHSEMLWPPTYGVLTPVCLDIAEGLRILHCTSDILGIKKMNDRIEIIVYGDRDLMGEIVFEGVHAHRITTASIDAEELQIQNDGKRIAITYPHKHKSELILSIKISGIR